MDLDNGLFRFLNGLAGHNKILDQGVIFVGHYLPYLLVVCLVLFWLFKRKERSYVLLGLFSAFFARFVVVEAIRAIFFRSRPFVNQAAVKLIEKGNEPSFPSGHAAALFAIGLAVYFYNKKLGSWLFVVAGVVSLARVVGGVHYPSDILGGWAVGIVCAWLTEKLSKNRLKKYS